MKLNLTMRLPCNNISVFVEPKTKTSGKIGNYHSKVLCFLLCVDIGLVSKLLSKLMPVF